MDELRTNEITEDGGRITEGSLSPQQKLARAFARPSPTRGKPRLTVQEQITHEVPGPGGSSFQVPGAAWCAELASDEQPYGPRRFEVGEDWEPLDCGWVEKVGVGVVWLANDGEVDLYVGKYIGVYEGESFVEFCHVISPKQTQRCQFVGVDKWRLCSAKGKCRVRIVAFPR